MAKRRCQGKTKLGKRCTRRGVAWCAQHADQAPAGAAAPDTDRTPKKARARKQDWRLRFLAAFGEHVTVAEACRVAGVGHSTVYDERARNEAFAVAWAAVEERTTQRMEREGFRRAVDGWIERQEFELKEVDGEMVQIPTLIVRKFSDTLLIFMLKARRPDTYRENVRHEHSGPDGGPVSLRLDLDAGGRKALGDVLRSRPAASDDD